MARGPRYRVVFRRRRQGKTNYHRRLKLIQSRRDRIVIRCSLKNIVVQVINAKLGGDKILVASYSKHLTKLYNWKYNLANLPSAYLTGYLCGVRAKKAKIEDAILDVGIMVHQDKVKAAFKGFLDGSGIDIPHNDEWFSETLTERVTGIHIKNYAEKIAKDKAKKIIFSKNIEQKADPTNIVDEFKKVKDLISKNT